MSKFIGWAFVVVFALVAILYAFGVIEPTATGNAITYAVLAYIAYNADVKVSVKR